MKRNPKSLRKYLNVCLACVLLLSAIFCCTSCSGGGSSTPKLLTGSYHVEKDKNGNKRGADVEVSMQDGKISAIVTVANKDYSMADPKAQFNSWGIKGNQVILGVSKMSISDIKAIKVTCDANGIPTAVTGYAGIPSDLTDVSGLFILAVQDALKKA